MKATNTQEKNQHPFEDGAANSVLLVSRAINAGGLPTGAGNWVASNIVQSDSLLAFCRDHEVTGLCALALKDSANLNSTWEHEFAFAEYKHVLQAAERDVVLEALEQHHIRHMPLKGTILSELYPNPIMREMCDSDILVDSTKTREVNALMKSLGFEPGVDSACHQSYTKKPFLNFEMHRRLFDDVALPKAAEYYRNPWSMAQLDNDKSYRYHFSPTDFYVYMTLHAYKHYSGAGFGLRTLADEAVMLRKLPDIDFERVSKVMKDLETHEFEATLRGLSTKLFDPALLADEGRPLYDAIAGKSEVLSPTELRMLRHVVVSGAYGTVDQAIEKLIRKKLGKSDEEELHLSSLDNVVYVLRRLFPSVQELKRSYPMLERPAGMILLPGVFVMRIVRRLTVNRNLTAIELGELRKAQA